MSDDSIQSRRPKRPPLDRLIDVGVIVHDHVRPAAEAEMAAIIREVFDARESAWQALLDDVKHQLLGELRAVRKEQAAQSELIREQRAKLLELAGKNSVLRDELDELKAKVEAA